MSAVTSRQRVPAPPTCKLPRLTIETDPVRDAFGSSHDAEIPRTPSADDESALLMSPRLLLHTGLHYLTPNAYNLETCIVQQAFAFVGNPLFCILEGIALQWNTPERVFSRGKECIAREG